jgi:pimeloyl-ACP methyl ester carboxylesterase
MTELAFEPAFVVGHDIGAMVAYALGRAHPEAVRGVMLVETVIAGLEPWDALKSDPALWHFGFFQSERFPELLLTDREVVFFREFLNGGLSRDEAISDDDVARYARAYTGRERLHAGLGFYRAFPENEELNAADRGTNEVPVVVVFGGSDGGLAPLAPTLTRALSEQGWINVTSETVPNAGHYVLDEQPEQMVQLIERHAGE